MGVADILRVMVVDDHMTSRMLTVETLQSFGLSHIAVAKDGRDAFTNLVAKPVHLVISDLYMPDVDGLKLLQAVRSHPKLAKTGFIVITGRKDDDVVAKAKSFGVNNVLGKPFTPIVLKQAVESVVGRLN